MKLADARRRLPVVDQLPQADNRKVLPVAEGEVPIPRLAVWELTAACDQACLHCGPRSAKARPDELSTEECLQLVEEMAEMGVGEVVLIGGEPYLRNDFILIIRRIRELGMAAILTTGAYNLNDARIEGMIEAGILSVSFSIDGLEQSHDYVRNRADSWKRAFAAMRKAKACGASVAVNSQINAINRHEHPELLELIADAGAHSWQVQITIAHGNAADHPELILQPYMMLEVFEMLERVADRARERGVRMWPGNNLGYFGPVEHKLRRFQAGPQGHYKGCAAGRSTLGIESNGMIKNCPSQGGPVNIGGSWREHGLKAIWNRAPEMTYFRRRTVEDLWGYCRECYYAATCMAGCTAAAEPLLGRPGNNPFCHHRAIEMDRLGMRERIEKVADAPGVPFDNALFRVIREHKDPARRAAEGPVEITEPRVSRLEVEMGPGYPIGAPSE